MTSDGSSETAQRSVIWSMRGSPRGRAYQGIGLKDTAKALLSSSALTNTSSNWCPFEWHARYVCMSLGRNGRHGGHQEPAK